MPGGEPAVRSPVRTGDAAVPQDDFIAYLHELLEPIGKVSARAMFGGWGVYLDGTIMGIVVEGRLYLKVDEVTEPGFIATGNAPFTYPTPKGPMAMSYWSVPAEALDSADAMAPWAKLALEAARRKAAAKKPKSTAKAKPAQPKPESLRNRTPDTQPVKKMGTTRASAAAKKTRAAAVATPAKGLGVRSKRSG
jgi:DNA transformation protein